MHEKNCIDCVFYRMANFSVEGQDGGEYWGPSDGSLRHFAKKAADISLPGTGGSSSRSLFIFSEENFIRKYAKIIIEWGYPLLHKMRLHRMKFQIYHCILPLFIEVTQYCSS